MDYKKIFGWLFLICGVMFLISILAWTLTTLQAFSDLSHEQEIERLLLKKEIALINNNVTNPIIIKDYECEYRLNNQTIQYLRELRELERHYEDFS